MKEEKKILEQRTSGRGVQFEWAIVYWALKISKSKDFNKRLRARPELKMYGMGEMKDYAISAVNVAKKAGAPLSQAKHSDEEGIEGDPEPKTDLTFGKQRVSVKMSGAIQLSSSEGRRTAQMFQAILDEMKKDSKFKKKLNQKVLKGIIERIHIMPDKMLDASKPANIKKALKMKPNQVKNMMKRGKVLDEYNWNLWSENNKKDILEDVIQYLENSPEFNFRLIEEALTGKRNFGDKDRATSDYIMTPTFYGKIDASYVKKMMKTTKIDVRAKSRSGITSVTMRFDVADAAKAAKVQLEEGAISDLAKKGWETVKNLGKRVLDSFKDKLRTWFTKNIDTVVDGALDDVVVEDIEPSTQTQKEHLTNTEVSYTMLTEMIENLMSKE